MVKEQMRVEGNRHVIAEVRREVAFAVANIHAELERLQAVLDEAAQRTEESE